MIEVINPLRYTKNVTGNKSVFASVKRNTHGTFCNDDDLGIVDGTSRVLPLSTRNEFILRFCKPRKGGNAGMAFCEIIFLFKMRWTLARRCFTSHRRR